jgi:hypothetical protein
VQDKAGQDRAKQGTRKEEKCQDGVEDETWCGIEISSSKRGRLSRGIGHRAAYLESV